MARILANKQYPERNLGALSSRVDFDHPNGFLYYNFCTLKKTKRKEKSNITSRSSSSSSSKLIMFIKKERQYPAAYIVIMTIIIAVTFLAASVHSSSCLPSFNVSPSKVGCLNLDKIVFEARVDSIPDASSAYQTRGNLTVSIRDIYTWKPYPFLKDRVIKTNNNYTFPVDFSAMKWKDGEKSKYFVFGITFTSSEERSCSFSDLIPYTLNLKCE